MATKRNSHPSSGAIRPSPWDKVQVRNGKLIGVLTDELAKSTFPQQGEGTISATPLLDIPKVHKRLPNKFK